MHAVSMNYVYKVEKIQVYTAALLLKLSWSENCKHISKGKKIKLISLFSSFCFTGSESPSELPYAHVMGRSDP